MSCKGKEAAVTGLETARGVVMCTATASIPCSHAEEVQVHWSKNSSVDGQYGNLEARGVRGRRALRGSYPGDDPRDGRVRTF